MKSSCIYTCILLCLYVCNLHGQTLDDNIVITQCSDSYIFMEEDGIPTVRNRKDTSYEATRMGTALQPYTYYGEFISLDGASAKGGGKAEYKSITPENVFFDDSKVCFFNINLDRKGKKTEVTFINIPIYSGSHSLYMLGNLYPQTKRLLVYVMINL